MSLAHEGDHYARLNALCKREGYGLGVGVAGGVLRLTVGTPEKVHHAAFRSGYENEAARDLLHRLRGVAA